MAFIAAPEVLHEWRRPAEVCVGVARWCELGEDRPGETPGPVVVPTFDVVGTWAAVADVGMHVWKRSEEPAGFGGERVVAPAARAMEPPDLSFAVFRGKRLEHGEDRGGADAGADQQYRRVGSVEDERASRSSDIELSADVEAGMQIATGRPVGFALDADPVVAGIGRSRKGVVPQQRPLLVVAFQAQREVLTRTWVRERRAIRILEPDGDHRIALSLDCGHGQSTETGPCRRRAGRAQAGVATAGFSVDEGAKRRLPARA
jgi:hypothetical protein